MVKIKVSNGKGGEKQMNRKKILIVLACIVALAVPFSVYAATSDTTAAKAVRGFFRLDPSKFTDQQKADVKDYTQKMADLQKDFINKMVANGAMTKEQGDAAIARIDEALKNGDKVGLIPGFGMEKGGFGGHGRPDGDDRNAIDTSKLTDQQKADLIVTYKKMADLEKDLVNKMVASGAITKEKGDAAIKRIDDLTGNLQQNNLPQGMKMFMGGFGMFELRGVDTSKLTDQQKADLTDFSTKMTDLRKELINKMVASGAMTKDQGDAAIKRMDSMPKNFWENGFPKDKGMRRGAFGGHGKQGGSNANEGTTQAQ